MITRVTYTTLGFGALAMAIYRLVGQPNIDEAIQWVILGAISLHTANKS